MNADIKERWIAALTDGSYEQGQGKLRDGDNHFCCLGVLADLVAPEDWESASPSQEFNGDANGVSGPWVHRGGNIGMPDGSLYDETGLAFELADELAAANDAGKSFTDIAEGIRLRA